MAHPHAAYQIIEIAAGGSYGTVCVVQELLATKNRVLAMKVLDLDQLQHENILARARDEVRILSRLKHPNVVAVEPVLQVYGRPVVIMEYVNGATLEQVIRACPDGVPAPEATEIIKRASRGLAAAWHTPVGPKQQPMKIVHRDVKPANIMISDKAEVKVVDFGLAKANFEDRETKTGFMVVGSKGYMSPERNDGIDHTPACDVYSLGLTLFELCTGKKMVVSMRETKHDADLERTLEHASPVGLEGKALEMFRELIASMCSYSPSTRPEMRDIPGILIEIQKEGRLKADLEAFGANTVRPLIDDRKRLAPNKHPRYSNVEFLEEAPPAEAMSVNVDMNPWTDEGQLSQHSGELADLIATYPQSDVGPLLAILDEAMVPRWKFWKRSPPVPVILGALNALSSRNEQAFIERLHNLKNHRNPEVSSAAAALLEPGKSSE